MIRRNRCKELGLLLVVLGVILPLTGAAQPANPWQAFL